MKLKKLIALGLLVLPLAASASENDVTTISGGMEVRANPSVSSPFAIAVDKAREELRARLEAIRLSGASPEQQARDREAANKTYHEQVNQARAEARAQRREMIRKRELSMDANLEAKLERMTEHAGH